MIKTLVKFCFILVALSLSGIVNAQDVLTPLFVMLKPSVYERVDLASPNARKIYGHDLTTTTFSLRNPEKTSRTKALVFNYISSPSPSGLSFEKPRKILENEFSKITFTTPEKFLALLKQYDLSFNKSYKLYFVERRPDGLLLTHVVKAFSFGDNDIDLIGP